MLAKALGLRQSRPNVALAEDPKGLEQRILGTTKSTATKQGSLVYYYSYEKFYPIKGTYLFG